MITKYEQRLPNPKGGTFVSLILPIVLFVGVLIALLFSVLPSQ